MMLDDVANQKRFPLFQFELGGEEPKAPRATDKSNSKAYTTVVTSVLTISELMALLLDLGC